MVKTLFFYGLFLSLLTGSPAFAQALKQQWDQVYGSAGSDFPRSGLATADGGYLIASEISSTGGSISGTAYGNGDIWLLKLGSDKITAEWQLILGGADNEHSPVVIQTADGGFLVACASASAPGGNKTAVNYGKADYWLIRLDAKGNILWDKSYGGSENETPAYLAEMDDQSILLGGTSSSNPSGNKTAANYGAEDFWVLRLDEKGNEIW